MELSFITSALKRYFWVVIIFAALGAIPGLLRENPSGDRYASTGVLLIAPSTESRVASQSGDPDRYISGQISVLGSDLLADRVAEQISDELGDEYTGDGVGAAVTFEHEPGTDIVGINATTPVARVSQAISNAYIDQYFGALRTQVDTTQAEEISELTGRVSELRARLDTVNTQLADAIRPYLPTGPVEGDQTIPPTPALEQVAPGLVTEQAILLQELETASGSLAALESARLRVASEIVQQASLPDEPEPQPVNRLLIMGIIGGAFLGMVVAIVLARLSPWILDDTQAADILGQPMVGALPASRLLARDRRRMIEQVPANLNPFVNALSVRTEVDAEAQSLTIAVVGTRGGAGSTTLAALIATRFAQSGSPVLLVDADPRHRELAQLYPVARTLEVDETGEVRGLTSNEELAPDMVNEPVANLRITVADVDTLRRPQPTADLFESLVVLADVIVYDAGPLMSSASSIELARQSDSVVVAVPRSQTIRGLNAVARTLRRQDFLPVWTPVPKRRRSSRRRRQTPSVPEQPVAPADDALVTTS